MVHIYANWYVFGKYVHICKYVRIYRIRTNSHKYVPFLSFIYIMHVLILLRMACHTGAR